MCILSEYDHFTLSSLFPQQENQNPEWDGLPCHVPQWGEKNDVLCTNDDISMWRDDVQEAALVTCEIQLCCFIVF